MKQLSIFIVLFVRKIALHREMKLSYAIHAQSVSINYIINLFSPGALRFLGRLGSVSTKLIE